MPPHSAEQFNSLHPTPNSAPGPRRLGDHSLSQARGKVTPALGGLAAWDDLSPRHLLALGASVSSSVKAGTYLDSCEA